MLQVSKGGPMQDARGVPAKFGLQSGQFYKALYSIHARLWEWMFCVLSRCGCILDKAPSLQKNENAIS